ncbi:MAG: 50S ribosomal protein L27 [bacterium]|nr:50S ribosomal protein L27 [bacterium]
MAHTKAKGTSKLGRDSISKRLGVKIFGGMKAKTGDIIIRQRGSKFYAGENTAMGTDDTIYAKVDGVVKFQLKSIKKFDGSLEKTQVVAVEIVK